MILERMDFMHPGFLRVIGGASYSGGRNPKVYFTSNWAEKHNCTKILSWAQKHKCKVILGTWTPALMIKPQNVINWARRVAVHVAYLRRQRGFTCIRFYNFINEPERMPIARWTWLAMNLQTAFSRFGLAGTVGIIGPDTYGDPGNSRRYNFPLLRQIAQHAAKAVGLYDIHWYAQDWEVYDGTIERTLKREKRMVESIDPVAASKPFVVSESGLIQGRCNGDQQPRVKTFNYGVMMADYAAQVFRAGWNGISAWDMDDAMHFVAGQAVTHPPGKLTLKIWGFWNSQGAAMGNPSDFNLRPWFYTWSLMSRMFPAGTRIIKTLYPKGVTRFTALAGTHRIGDKLAISIVLVNNSGKSRNIVVRIAGDANATTFSEYRYFRHDRPVNLQGFPVAAKIRHGLIPAEGMNIAMPGRGVVLLTTQAPFAVQ